MRGFKKVIVGAIVLVCLFTLTACNNEKKEEVKESEYVQYEGYEFKGNDPWGNEVVVNIKKVENGNITWTYANTVTVEGNVLKIYNDVTGEIKNNSTSFDVTGDIDDIHNFDYAGTLTLKNNALEIKYETGDIATSGEDNSTFSYQVQELEENAKTFTLTKVAK